MCDPVSIAIVAGVTAVASTGASIVSQIHTAKVQKKALLEQNAAAKTETKNEASAQLFDSMREARREQGQIRAQAGESGLSLTSGSVESMLMDSAMQGELRDQRIIANMESRDQANNAEAASAASKIQSPTALGAGLQLGGAALQAFSSYASAAKIQKG